MVLQSFSPLWNSVENRCWPWTPRVCLSLCQGGIHWMQKTRYLWDLCYICNILNICHIENISWQPVMSCLSSLVVWMRIINHLWKKITVSSASCDSCHLFSRYIASCACGDNGNHSMLHAQGSKGLSWGIMWLKGGCCWRLQMVVHQHMGPEVGYESIDSNIGSLNHCTLYGAWCCICCMFYMFSMWMIGNLYVNFVCNLYVNHMYTLCIS